MSPRVIHTTLSTAVLLAIVSLSVGCAKLEPPSGGAPAPGGVAAPADPKPPSIADASRESRKIIRNAELSVTVSSATEAQREAAKLAERHGGYLVSSDASHASSEDGAEPTSVSVVLRVDADKFEAALEAIRSLGKGVGSESITSKDVTEEWVDLDARIKTQKKLEEQYLEILKSASKVEDLLSVQKQLAEVRGELEKLEGRKRLLQNQVALSTISVTFREERPLVAVTASAFGRAAKHAWADVQNVGAGIVLALIRLVGVMLPVTLLVLLPLYFAGRLLVRRLMASTALRRAESA